MTTTKTFTPQSFLVARAINPQVVQGWTDEDWGSDAKLSELRWEKVGAIATQPKGKYSFSEDYNLVDVDACKAVGRQVEWLRAKGNEAARLTTFEVNGNVYRVSRI